MKRLLVCAFVALLTVLSSAQDKPIHVAAKVQSVAQDKEGKLGAVLTPFLPADFEVMLVKGELPKPNSVVDCAAYGVEIETNIQVIELKCGDATFRISRVLFQETK